MYIIKCIPTPKKATERNPKVMYYEGTWESETNIYNTSKQQAKKFNTRQEAEKVANPLLTAGKIKSYMIVAEDE
jgi:hypothetical protein